MKIVLVQLLSTLSTGQSVLALLQESSGIQHSTDIVLQDVRHYKKQGLRHHSLFGHSSQQHLRGRFQQDILHSNISQPSEEDEYSYFPAPKRGLKSWVHLFYDKYNQEGDGGSDDPPAPPSDSYDPPLVPQSQPFDPPFNIEDVCPCTFGWKNHEKYVKCVQRAVKGFNQKRRVRIIWKAERSDCGKSTVVPPTSATTSTTSTTSKSTEATTVTTTTPKTSTTTKTTVSTTTTTTTASTAPITSGTHQEISGKMWLDLNNNGMMDTGESAMPGRKVESLHLELSGWELVSEAVTNANGAFSFDTDSGSYKIRFHLNSEEADCCDPSHRGTPDSDNHISHNVPLCVSYYETDVIEVGSSNTVNGGFICGSCPWPAFSTVVNNAVPVPDIDGYDGKNFSSYNAASVNTESFVVFRARSTGGENPSTGIFVRDALDSSSTIIRQAGRRTTVPPPNNLDTTFIEFPSFPRIATDKCHIATRGNHGPVIEYELGEEEDGEDTTRIGNTGLYFNLEAKGDTESDDTSANFHTGIAKLGSLANYSIYQVPGLQEGNGIAFDVFPGSPAIDNEGVIAFKGNYAKGNISQTGIFYRKVVQQSGGGEGNLIYVVANSETEIPPPTTSCQTTTFGSTAPPSTANGKVLFRGVDIEDEPKCGGIYEASLDFVNFPELKTLVNMETNVPGEGDNKFTRFGEGLSCDQNGAVAFWGAWGNETETISLCCPETGNKDRRSFCLKNDTDTICNSNTAPEGCNSGCYQNKLVSVNQGIFVYKQGSITAVAKASTNDGKTFVFWNYSGKPPSAGPGEGGHSHRWRRLSSATDGDDTEAAEPPRWRSSATVALSQHNSIVYKMKDNDKIGIVHWEGGALNSGRIIAETGQDCTSLDTSLTNSGAPLVIESLAIERDSFRGSRLVISAACAEVSVDEVDAEKDDDDGDWGGIYMTKICPPRA